MDKAKIVLQNTGIRKDNHQFDDIVKIVESAKDRAYRKVNEELILMYQEVGKYISEKSKEAAYGSNFVENVADFFSENYPDLKGFTRRGLYRMKQFYEIYKDDEKVSTLLTQLSWSNHLGYRPKVCKAKLMNILWHKLASALLKTQSTN